MVGTTLLQKYSVWHIFHFSLSQTYLVHLKNLFWICHRSRDYELPLPLVTRKRSKKKNADLQADTNLNSLIARM